MIMASHVSQTSEARGGVAVTNEMVNVLLPIEDFVFR